MNFYNTTVEKIEKGPLKIITFGGTETVTKNMTVYEYNDNIIIVDCGIGMPDSDMLGVNVVIPDFTYLLENSHKIRGLFITHGHEDHIGAVPYLIDQLDIPVYANKLVQGFISEKIKNGQFKNLGPRIRFSLIDSTTGETTVGPFKVSAFNVNHSVPASMGFAINTPEGLILHMADYKIDWTPVLDPPIDLGRIAQYGSQGVLCLLSDCLNVTSEGYSMSESTLSETFVDLFENSEKRQVLITTISSNISRMYQIITAALKHGRKVVLAGRSIDQSVDVARRLGYLKFADEVFVAEKDASSYAQGDLVYIIAGCFGQQGSALDRLSRNEHEGIVLEKDSIVVFSADPNPPGVAQDVERMMSNLTILGAEVIYSKIQENLHVSGHGTKGDLTIIAAITKAKYYIPLGGTITKMRAYTKMLGGLGVDKNRVFELHEGDSVAFASGKAELGDHFETKPVYIEGNSVDALNPIVIKDRGQLSTEGVFVVVIPASRDGTLYEDKVEVITRGFIYVKGSQELMDKSKKFIVKVIAKHKEKNLDWSSLRRKIENETENFLHKETGHSPLIIVHSVMI